MHFEYLKSAKSGFCGFGLSHFFTQNHEIRTVFLGFGMLFLGIEVVNFKLIFDYSTVYGTHRQLKEMEHAFSFFNIQQYVTNMAPQCNLAGHFIVA